MIHLRQLLNDSSLQALIGSVRQPAPETATYEGQTPPEMAVFVSSVAPAQQKGWDVCAIIPWADAMSRTVLAPAGSLIPETDACIRISNRGKVVGTPTLITLLAAPELAEA